MLYTVKEVSELLKTNPTYVYKLIKTGKLPAIKIGAMKIRHEALKNFLETYEGYDLTDPYEQKELRYGDDS